ncbi:MAG: hypothetical protein DRP71_02330 [Verrucomicrobia bacterium]|nr:MAG: hypothetical protein DRP71_02330 [Verrucomicrobiota bacterium]
MSSESNPEKLSSFRHRLVRSLDSKVDGILASGRSNGQFGTEPWIVRDQDVILTLAMLFKSELSHYHGNTDLLHAIAAGGRFLRERHDEKGMYLFNKKDGSEWGMIYMPWTYLRWMITYDLLAEELSDQDRQIWEEGLLLGYSGISATELSSASSIYPGPLPFEKAPAEGEVIPWVHNIPSHHAAGLYLAGKRFGRQDWQQQALDYMDLVEAAQSEYGWWTEHVGPVVLYNRVYLEALAIFYHYSRAEGVGRILERGNTFHFNYTYPDGSSIETVDERNPYPPLEVVRNEDGGVTTLARLMPAHPGLYYSDHGRALLTHLLQQLEVRGSKEITDAEMLLLCLSDGDGGPGPASTPPSRHRMGDRALLVRESPWLLSFSAYCAPRTPNRFIQDRQNLVSIYHRDAGLIVGGGNTKLQPLWSTMTVGDTDLVSPRGTTRKSDLAPETDLAYVPEKTAIEETDGKVWSLRIETGGAITEISSEILSADTLQITARLLKAPPTGLPVANHFTFIRYPESPVAFSDGTTDELGKGQFKKTGLEWIRHHVWDLSLPREAGVSWPVLPHNPYAGDGHADHTQGRLVVTLPFLNEGESHAVRLKVGVRAGGQ